MRKYIEINSEYEIDWKIKELNEEFGIKNLSISEIKDELKPKSYVDISTLNGDAVRVEAQYNILETFINRMK